MHLMLNLKTRVDKNIILIDTSTVKFIIKEKRVEDYRNDLLQGFHLVDK